ncbi:MAG: GNAT family N-acetyltransferase [archaeon]
MIIRKYQPTDKEQVKLIIKEVLTEFFEKTFIKEWENFEEYSAFYIAEDNGKIIGTIAMKNQGNNIGRLKRMYVDKEYRKKGIAQKLYDQLENSAKNQGIRKISLTTHKTMMGPANNFYKKNGYKQLKEVSYELFPELKNEDVNLAEVIAYEKTLNLSQGKVSQDFRNENISESARKSKDFRQNRRLSGI